MIPSALNKLVGHFVKYILSKSNNPNENGNYYYFVSYNDYLGYVKESSLKEFNFILHPNPLPQEEVPKENEQNEPTTTTKDDSLIKGIISVTRVDTTNDLSLSKVYVSIFTPNGDKKEVFNQICHSAGFLRRELCERIDLRKVPYLEFILDDSLEYGQRIDEVIDKINDERDNNEV